MRQTFQLFKIDGILPLHCIGRLALKGSLFLDNHLIFIGTDKTQFKTGVSISEFLKILPATEQSRVWGGLIMAFKVVKLFSYWCRVNKFYLYEKLLNNNNRKSNCDVFDSFIFCQEVLIKYIFL